MFGSSKDLAAEALKGMGKEPDGDEAGEGDDEGLMAAAEEILSAIAAKDPKALAGALRNAYACCEDVKE